MADIGIDFKRLTPAIDWSIRQMDKPKTERVKFIQQYVGNHFSSGGSDKAVPTNFIELAVMIYMQQLAARSPRCTFDTEVVRLKPWAFTTEIELNKIPDEIGLDATLRRAFMEALFGFAAVKTGMCSSGIEILGHDVGRSFCDLVSIDDYFCDMSAKCRADMQFEGNDYWLPVEDARTIYNNNKIQPDQHTLVGPQGEVRAESVSTDEGADLYKEKIWLRDVWIPRTNVFMTYGVQTKEIFETKEWDGPEAGPYDLLGFSDVPGNLLPLPPVALWYDLHELANNLFRKLGRQADEKKSFAALHGGSDDDKSAIVQVKDGEGVKVGAAKVDNVTVGGIDAPTLAFYLQVKDQASYFGGNWDALAGLGKMSDTVGQDEIMKEGANARLEFMRDRTLDFARSIFKKLAWYRWTDPVRKSDVSKPVKGSSLRVSAVFSEDTREGDWLDYNFDIDVYSMRSDTPAIKLQKILQYLERVVYPALPLLQQQGASIDFKTLNSLAAELSNVPELEDILVFGEPPQGLPEQGNSEPTRMPTTTTRNYTRTNRSGATERGKADVMSRLLMGGNVQPSEGSQIG